MTQLQRVFYKKTVNIHSKKTDENDNEIVKSTLPRYMNNNRKLSTAQARQSRFFNK